MACRWGGEAACLRRIVDYVMSYAEPHVEHEGVNQHAKEAGHGQVNVAAQLPPEEGSDGGDPKRSCFGRSAAAACWAGDAGSQYGSGEFPG